jgi:hypothetical protein
MVQLVKSKSGVAEHEAQHPGRGAAIANDGNRIGATNTLADGTQGTFTTAQDQAGEVTKASQQHEAEAQSKGQTAAANASKADEAATTLTAERDTLAARLAEWAAAHKAAREEAIKETVARMQARGLQVTHVPEH